MAEAADRGESSGSAREAELVASLRAGDAAAYERLVRAEGPRLMAVALRFLHNEEDARDAVQEAFLSAFRGLKDFDGTALVSTWLHRIVVNAALTRLRTRRRKPERSLESLLPRFGGDGHQIDPPAKWQETAEQLLARRETRALVRAAIDELPDSYREVLLLRDIEGIDTQETAQMLGLNVLSTKSRLHRARQALRTLLEPHVGRGDA